MNEFKTTVIIVIVLSVSLLVGSYFIEDRLANDSRIREQLQQQAEQDPLKGVTPISDFALDPLEVTLIIVGIGFLIIIMFLAWRSYLCKEPTTMLAPSSGACYKDLNVE